jgi:hypothetical protein
MVAGIGVELECSVTFSGVEAKKQLSSHDHSLPARDRSWVTDLLEYGVNFARKTGRLAGGLFAQAFGCKG